MNDIEKMLRSLSKANINYRSDFDPDIDFGAENTISEKNNISCTCDLPDENYKRPKLRIITAAAFSLVIVAGIGLYAINICHILDTAPSVQFSSAYTSQTSDTLISQNISYVEFFGLDGEVPEMSFSIFGRYNGIKRAYIDGQNGSYAVGDKEKCAEILQLLTDRHIEETSVAVSRDDQKDTDWTNWPFTGKVTDTDKIDFELPGGTQIVIENDNGNELLYVRKDSEEYICYTLAPDTYDSAADIIMDSVNISAAESIFPEIKAPETMRFKATAAFNLQMPETRNEEFFIDDAAKCADIIGLISENCIEKADGITILNANNKEILMKQSGDTFPYKHESEDGEIILTPAQIKFIIPNTNTGLTLLSWHYKDYLLTEQNGDKTLYKLRECIYYEIYDMIKDIVTEQQDKIPDEISCTLSDGKGNTLPISQKILKSVSKKGLDYIVMSDLLQTDLKDIPVGFYTASDQHIDCYDINGSKCPDLPGQNFKIEVFEENGKKTMNILIIAETISPPETPSYELTKCTLKGGFNGIMQTDCIGGKNHEEHSYPIKFDFEYYFDLP